MSYLFLLYLLLCALPKTKQHCTTTNAEEGEGTKIYVGNLSFDTTAETIEAAFKAHGDVIECFMPVDYEGNPRGFAFVSMKEEDAVKAIAAMHETELDGRVLNVNKSLPRGQKSKPTREYYSVQFVDRLGETTILSMCTYFISHFNLETKLYVGNLSWGTEEGALRELFEEYGKQ